MKRFLMTSAIILTTASAGFAQSQDGNDQMRAAVGSYLATTQYSVDVDSLTTEQLAQLHGAFTSTDNASKSDAEIRAVLNDSNVVFEERSAEVMVGETAMPRSQLYTTVETALIGTKYEGMASTLTDEQLVQAYSAINSSDDSGDVETKLSAVFN